MSAVPSEGDERRRYGKVADVPILLQKSVAANREA
jgi:hypothetical protein